MPELSFYNEFRRKLVHLSSLWIPVVMSICSQYRYELAFIFCLLTVASILVEHAYAQGNLFIRKIYDFFFGRMLRNPPRKTDWIISGGPPVLGAGCIMLILFPAMLASASMAVMLLGDTAAALIGKRWGRIRFSNGKSLEGVIAFIIAGTAGFTVFYMWKDGFSFYLLSIAFIAAAVGSAVEFFQNKLKIDDNLLIPLCAGMTGWLFLI